MFASFRRRLHTKTIFVPEVRLFSISLLVCEFNPHRQTWYQKFTGTYPPLIETDKKNLFIPCKQTRVITRHRFGHSNVAFVCFSNEYQNVSPVNHQQKWEFLVFMT